MDIETQGLCFAYGGHRVLTDISFSISQGELVGILGPNGVGKSTLFRCILGLLKPQNGVVRIGGEAVEELSRTEIARRIAYIPQSTYPAFNYTVLEMILMGMSSRIGIVQAPGREHIAQAEQAMDAVGVGHLKERNYSLISGGERQLVLLARALAQKAKILVMDEPTANLDFGNQHRVMKKIRELIEDGYSIIMSTHDPAHAFLYTTRALVIYRGQVLCDGEPEKALTEEVISKVYGVNVEMGYMAVGEKRVTVCLPRD